MFFDTKVIFLEKQIHVESIDNGKEDDDSEKKLIDIDNSNMTDKIMQSRYFNKYIKN